MFTSKFTFFGTRFFGVALLVALVALATPAIVLAVTNAVTIDGNVLVPGDWDDELCRADDGGNNDAAGQRDLTRLCAASNYAETQPGTTLYVRWDFDDTDFSGSNSGDGCALFDTNRDGNVNAALCTTIAGNPATIQSLTLYSCNNSRGDRCAGATILPGFTGQCGVHLLAPTNPFLPANTDTDVECMIPLSNISVTPGSVILANVCSYPSQQPNSAPGDCTLTPSRLLIDTTTGINAETTPTSIDVASTGVATPGREALTPLALLIAGAGLAWLVLKRRRAVNL